MYTLEKDNSRANTLSRRHDITGTKLITNSILLKFNKNRLLGLVKILN